MLRSSSLCSSGQVHSGLLASGNARLVALAIAAAVLAGCGSQAAPAPQARPAIVVQPQSAGALQAQTYSGEVKPRYEASVGFRVGGKIVERSVDVGAKVIKGALLMRLDPSDTALGAAAATAGRAQAEADLALAKAELERHRALYTRKYISKSLLDVRQAAYDASAARARQARAQASEAGNQAAYATLRADSDGTVTAVLADAGQVVAAGTPVLRIAREGEVEVAIDVPESRVAEFAVQQPAQIEVWALGKARRTGTVREVSPQADPMSRTYPVRIALDDPSGLKFGMTARVGVARALPAGEVLVPLAAIDELDGKTAVWRVEPATFKVERRAVGVIRYREDGALVTGLDADAWIVAAGVHKLDPGQVIAPIDAKNRAVSLTGKGAGGAGRPVAEL